MKRPDPPEKQVVLTEDEWKRRLSPDQYRVLRQQGTEPAFTGAFWNNHAAGTYRCAGCGETLFSSETQYDSGSGWPSFTAPTSGDRVETAVDRTHGMVRTEVCCAKCGGHLGHVFDDGPAPTEQRFCINSAALDFDPESKK